MGRAVKIILVLVVAFAIAFFMMGVLPQWVAISERVGARFLLAVTTLALCAAWSWFGLKFLVD